MSVTLGAYNQTKGCWLAMQLELAHTFFARIRGLLGRSGLSASRGLWIKPCNSIHMFGMRFPIDAVFLSRQGRVVKVVEHLRPGRLVLPVKSAESVIELPVGAIADTQTTVGDQISIVQSLSVDRGLWSVDRSPLGGKSDALLEGNPKHEIADPERLEFRIWDFGFPRRGSGG